MAKATTEQRAPGATLIQESVDRVEGTLVRAMRANSGRRRRLRFGLAALGGIALFAGGVALGGAALAPGVHAGAGNGPVFTVDCYNSVGGHKATSVSFGVATIYDQVRKNPAGVCVTLANSSDEEQQLEGKIAQLNARGTTCGFIDIKGGDTFYFDGDGRTDDPQEMTPSPGCGALFAINAFSSRPLVACRMSDTHAAVYPLGNATAAVLCERERLTVWKK